MRSVVVFEPVESHSLNYRPLYTHAIHSIHNFSVCFKSTTFCLDLISMATCSKSPCHKCILFTVGLWHHRPLPTYLPQILTTAYIPVPHRAYRAYWTPSGVYPYMYLATTI